MQPRSRGGRLASALTVTLLTAGAITGLSAAGASASTCLSWVAGQPPSPGSPDTQLNAVTVISPCDAWAVGTYASGTRVLDLIEHWNGAAWNVVASPQPGSGNFLDGVRAVSPSDIWAVGGYFNNAAETDLVLHWNGHTWSQVTSPSPGGSSRLMAVRAVSANDVWAVGMSANSGASHTVILRWNGRSWAQVKSPNPGIVNNLSGVAATSASDAWAVGVFIKNNRDRTLILHWNGRRWAQVTSPNPGTLGEYLGSVGATSARDAWAVGEFANGSGEDRTLILHWNGRKWAQIASPNPGGPHSQDMLKGVFATSRSNAWAVGYYINGSETLSNAVIAHWNGKKWAAEAGPRPEYSTTCSPLPPVPEATSGQSAGSTAAAETRHSLFTAADGRSPDGLSGAAARISAVRFPGPGPGSVCPR